MRGEASVLHLDLDAFFAAVEQRDKPSLRGRPVVVGGLGPRGVVATASYEARVFGVRSAMPAHEARRRCPHAAFLSGRFAAYRATSERVMALLRTLSPLVEPLSLDEAYVDLRSAAQPAPTDPDGLAGLVAGLKSELARTTGGLTASVGVASSKLVAKVASELAKPDGLRVVPAGTEVGLLRELPVGVIPGVGPVTGEKLHRIGVRTVGDLQAAAVSDLAQLLGRTYALALLDLAHARDDRPVEPEREAKSVSVEDTFAHDVTDRAELAAVLRRQAGQVAARLAAAGLFARTVSIKVRRFDFATLTRSRTLGAATDRADLLAGVAESLLAGVDATDGVRLLGVGVAGLTGVVQEDLFGDSDPAGPVTGGPGSGGPGSAGPGSGGPGSAGPGSGGPGSAGPDWVWPDSGATLPVGHRPEPEPVDAGAGPAVWLPGRDVRHDRLGRGWVWGAGLGRVTVRLETRDSGPGPVRTFAADDPELHPCEPEPLPAAGAEIR